MQAREEAGLGISGQRILSLETFERYHIGITLVDKFTTDSKDSMSTKLLKASNFCAQPNKRIVLSKSLVGSLANHSISLLKKLE